MNFHENCIYCNENRDTYVKVKMKIHTIFGFFEKYIFKINGDEYKNKLILPYCYKHANHTKIIRALLFLSYEGVFIFSILYWLIYGYLKNVYYAIPTIYILTLVVRFIVNLILRLTMSSYKDYPSSFFDFFTPRIIVSLGFKGKSGEKDSLNVTLNNDKIIQEFIKINEKNIYKSENELNNDPYPKPIEK